MDTLNKNKLLTDKIVFRSGATTANRIVMAPMQTNSGEKGGFASEDTLFYYRARSEVAGMIITEFHYVSENGGPCYTPGYPEQLGAYSDKHLEGLTKLASAIKKDGNLAILQIHHGGRKARVNYPDVPSDVHFSNQEVLLHILTDEEINQIIKDFGQATKRAIKAGFDGVEIHGAHHFLIQQFFSPQTNKREDKWGGNFENRCRFALAIVDEVKRVVKEEKKENFIIGYRISPDEVHGNQCGYTYKESARLVEKIVEKEIDYVHISLFDGYNSKPEGSDKTYAKIFSEVMDEQTKLIVIGGVVSEKQAQEVIDADGDLVAIGRGTLIDPLFAKKIIEGKGETILHEVSVDTIDYIKWTPGLLEAFSRKDCLNLPPVPGCERLIPYHKGIFEK